MPSDCPPDRVGRGQGGQGHQRCQAGPQDTGMSGAVKTAVAHNTAGTTHHITVQYAQCMVHNAQPDKTHPDDARPDDGHPNDDHPDDGRPDAVQARHHHARSIRADSDG